MSLLPAESVLAAAARISSLVRRTRTIRSDALSRIGPAIAEALKKKAENPEDFEALLDLLEDGDVDDYLSDPEALRDPEALEDGAAILSDLYGSPAAAARKLAHLAGAVTPLSLERLNAVAAVSVLSALARVNSAAQSLAGDGGAGSGGGGLFSTIVEAVLKGLLQGASRSLAPRPRRRRYTGWTRSRTTPRRRTRARQPRLEDIFGEILGTRRR